MSNKIKDKSILCEPEFIFISYGIRGHDGRQEELIESIKQLGDVKIIAPSLVDEVYESTEPLYKIKHRDDRKKVSTYIKFALYAVRYGSKLGKGKILFVDDYTASLIGLVMWLVIRPAVVIQDAREFYYKKRMPGLGNLFKFCERILFLLSDVVICANEERSQLMKVLYGIKKPVVFENVRTFEKKEEPTTGLLNSEVEERVIRIISTGGIFSERGTFEAIRAMKSLDDCELIILGVGSTKDRKAALIEVESLGLNNVKLMERVPYKELPELIESCHIGYIEYHQNDMNNIFCASGKLYEYLSLGLPIVTTNNISLRSFVSEHQVGVASDDFETAVKMVMANYESYRINAKAFSNEITSESNREKLVKFLQKEIGGRNAFVKS